jgi:acyl-CoA synthetase (NDP forming)
MNRDLSRLFRPKSIALFGGAWAVNVVAQLKKSGYSGKIWPVNPKRADILGIPCVPSIDALPGVPDAAFVGVNRDLTVETVRRLSAMGAGGATLFASGFSESDAEGTGGTALQAELVAAAGQMPILGPNCYGFLNYIDNVTLWPDQHGGVPVERGVAIISQSSNIAINMTMQARGLPVAYVCAAGNQAQTGAADIASALLDDGRVTAIGFYLEGFGDIRKLEALAKKAASLGKPVVALKAGRSEGSRAAAKTHTASLAGSAAASSALLKRLGFVEMFDIETFLETLKLLHFFGPLPGNRLLSVSCSGGEASLMSDMAEGTGITFPAFGKRQRGALKALLGPIVTIANPLDYHTFIWGDTQRMTAVFTAALMENFDLSVFVLDLPRADRCAPSGYQCAVDAIIAAKNATGARVAVLASMPENMPEGLGQIFAEAGIVVLGGMRTGLDAINAAIASGRMGTAALAAQPLLLTRFASKPFMLDEAAAKAALARHGLAVPRNIVAANSGDALAAALDQLRFPLAAKAMGVAHKTEAGAVAIGIKDPAALRTALAALPQDHGFLIEEMATGAIGELIIGVTRDETGMFLLTLGAGGVAAEVLRDTVHLLVPATQPEIISALKTLKTWPLFSGYRGKTACNVEAIAKAVLAVQRYVLHDPCVTGIDVNPLIAREQDAIAVDALIFTGEQEE